MLLLIIHTGAEVDPAKFFTRCTDCGALLAPASLEDVRADVPAGVAATQDKFWRCPACRHVYWKGSHVTDIEAHIIELAKKIAAQ